MVDICPSSNFVETLWVEQPYIVVYTSGIYCSLHLPNYTYQILRNLMHYEDIFFLISPCTHHNYNKRAYTDMLPYFCKTNQCTLEKYRKF